MEEPGGLQSMELQRVGHDWVTSLGPLVNTRCHCQGVLCMGEDVINPVLTRVGILAVPPPTPQTNIP